MIREHETLHWMFPDGSWRHVFAVARVVMETAHIATHSDRPMISRRWWRSEVREDARTMMESLHLALSDLIASTYWNWKAP